jgi:hypothetical protein
MRQRDYRSKLGIRRGFPLYSNWEYASGENFSLERNEKGYKNENTK